MPTTKEQFYTEMNALSDAINTKAGTSGKMTIAGMTTAVANISGGGGIEGGYNVTFMVGSDQYTIVSVAQGGIVKEPSVPHVSGYYFKGWYTGSGGTGTLVTFPYTPSADVTFYAKMGAVAVVGFTGMTGSGKTITRTDDIANVGGWTTSTSGSYVSVSNPLDSYWPFNEIAEITDADGNVFVKYPKMWMKWIVDENGYVDGVKFADNQADEDYFISDAYLDPSSPNEDRYLDYFALGKYEGSGSTSKVFSKSGQSCLLAQNRATFRTACRSYGIASNYYNGYQCMDYPQFIIYNLLCMMYFNTRSPQQDIYGGRTGYSGLPTWSSVSETGTCDGVTGLSGWNTSTCCLKLLGIENPYGNSEKILDGIMPYGTQMIYYCRLPQYYGDSASGTGYVGIGSPTFIVNSAMIARTKVLSGSLAKGVIVPNDSQSSVGLLFSQLETSSNLTNTAVLAQGGKYNSGANTGFWRMYVYKQSTSYMYETGCRLAYRPISS